MKVSDIMQKSPVCVSENTPVSEVGRLIFSLGIGGVPVIDKNKKLVGILTEEDITSRMYPTMGDLVEDYVHAKNFEAMEKNIIELLKVPASEIMNKNATTSADTSLMEAQSIMTVNKFSRLPVVDKDKKLIGIISNGDIFRYLLKNEIPRLEKERYAGFIARHYDLMVDWDLRFKYEFPALFRLFKKEKISSVLDVGVWTGEYTLGMAKRDLNKVLGLDHNPLMIKIANEKKEKLSTAIQKKVQFMLTDFNDLSERIKEKYDAAICMGNSLPYIPASSEKLFKEIYSSLREKNGIFIIQFLNIDRILMAENRLLSFKIQKSNLASEKEHLFVEFVDKDGKNSLKHHIIVFDNDGVNWIFKGTTTVDIRYLNKNIIGKMLKAVGFKKVSFYGNKGEYQGEYGPLSFSEPFRSSESEWLNIVAKK